MLSFKPAISLSSFTLIKRLFSSSSLLPLEWYHLHIWGYWYFSRQSWFQLVVPPAQCSKFSKPCFNNAWTDNFQMFKLVLEKVEEPEIKLPTSTGSSRKQESSKKTPISALLTAKAFDCVDHNKLWKILEEIRIPDHLTCLLRNRYAGQEAIVRTGHGFWTTD